MSDDAINGGMTEAATNGEPADPRAPLAAQLQELELFVARLESDGEELPPEAVVMVARLREIVQALDGLSASLEPPRRDDAGESHPG
ncbi:MAG: hypothetical protein H0W68_14235 [Gemmatimonadaceae bacterium]|nr:hypothetical protein [Gemmatimonadaceae bacterium]